MDTHCNDWFTADNSSITMGLNATVVQLVGGKDERGRHVGAALYQDAYRVIVYDDGEGEL